MKEQQMWGVVHPRLGLSTESLSAERDAVVSGLTKAQLAEGCQVAPITLYIPKIEAPVDDYTSFLRRVGQDWFCSQAQNTVDELDLKFEDLAALGIPVKAIVTGQVRCVSTRVTSALKAFLQAGVDCGRIKMSDEWAEILAALG